MQKKILAVNDISCFGKCSLTVALPILSAVGAETSVIPTAVLSTHTGGFPGYTYRDLTADLPKIAEHWKSVGLRFDAIYTGFLGSFEQLAIVSRLIEEFRTPETLVCVDPVMGDNGKLYASFGPDFPAGMAEFCRGADLITPNLTEAALLLGEPYRSGPLEKPYVEGLLRRLGELGPRNTVLTGVGFEESRTGCACYDRETGAIGYAFSEKLPGMYHGTGDIFASALVGAVAANGIPLLQAAQIAADYTAGCIRRTFEAGTDVRFGVNFEAGLPDYIRAVRNGSKG